MLHSAPLAIRLIGSFFATSLLITTLLPAQAVGGDFETLFQWNGETNHDAFGHSVANAGDVNADGFVDMIVGAPNFNSNGLASNGSAYVYSGKDGSLLYQWFGGNTLDQFADAVSAAGDLNADGFDDVIVGAYSASPSGLQYAGSAFAYSGADGSLLFQWDGRRTENYLGCSVAAAGDVNADGFDDVIIGAFHSRIGGSIRRGSAFVYSGADGSKIHRWNGQLSHDDFGCSVAGVGDINADGYDDLVVGAYRVMANDMVLAGAAYLYSGIDGSLIHQWFGETSVTSLGSSVSNAGDVNADGINDIIAGAPGARSSGSTGRGAAYIYSGADYSILHRLEGDVSSGEFGRSVAGAGDVNGDGFADVLIGDPASDDGLLTNVGTAYLFSGADGTLLHKWKGELEHDRFGISVSSIGDFNSDGLADIIISARRVGSLSPTGTALIYGFNPFLRASTSTISASTGGTPNLDLDFPDTAGFYKYRVLISATGTGPTFYGIDIPITLDSLASDTYLGYYPFPTYTDLHGTLDANANASASLTIPAGNPSSLIGNVYYVAAIANPMGQVPEYSSAAISVTIIP